MYISGIKALLTHQSPHIFLKKRRVFTDKKSTFVTAFLRWPQQALSHYLSTLLSLHCP